LKSETINKIINFFKNKFSIFFLILIISFTFFSCSQEKNYNAQLKGNTMGTYYIINLINVPKKLKIKKIEKEVKHDVIAFLTSVNEFVGDSGRYIHVGMTSSDVLDTGLSLQLKDSCELLLEEIEKSIKPNTKLVFGEVIGNPGLDVMNVPEVAKICKKKNVPLAIDATFNTPYLMKPISHGANIVIHSLTKWIGGHGIAIGGAVVNGGNFDWGNKEKFPTISGSHFALNGISFWEEFGPSALTAKIRAEGMYNFGPSLSPNNAFYILQGIETLSLRMKKHIENTKMMLEFLKENESVSWLRHPDLEDHPDHKIAKKILPLGSGSIIVFGIKGGRDAGKAFIENVKLSSHLANVGDAKTLLIHPGSTTHSHLSSEAMKMSGLTDDMIRLSVGLEDIEDIKIDFEKGFKAAAKISSNKS